jgi:L-cysteate sulfo-lyase
MAVLVAELGAAVRSGAIRPGRRTVFVHTGGLPGLYGHQLASELAERALGSATRISG